MLNIIIGLITLTGSVSVKWHRLIFLYGLIVIVVTFFIATCSLARITQNLKALDKWLVLISLMRSISKTHAKVLANVSLALALLI